MMMLTDELSCILNEFEKSTKSFPNIKVLSRKSSLLFEYSCKPSKRRLRDDMKISFCDALLCSSNGREISTTLCKNLIMLEVSFNSPTTTTQALIRNSKTESKFEKLRLAFSSLTAEPRTEELLNIHSVF